MMTELHPCYLVFSPTEIKVYVCGEMTTVAISLWQLESFGADVFDLVLSRDSNEDEFSHIDAVRIQGPYKLG